jgi:DNA-binding CsgD family transcriptional regulator
MQIATGDGADEERLDAAGLDSPDDGPPWSILLSLLRAQTLLIAGNLDAAREEADRALASAGASGTTFLEPAAAALLGEVALLRDEPERATAYVRAGLRPTRGVPTGPGADSFAWLHARLLDATGDRTHALTVLEGFYSDGSAHLPFLVERPGAAAWMVRLALSEDDRARASAVVTTVERLAAANTSIACVQVAASHARGLLDRDIGALGRAAKSHRDSWARASAAEDSGVAFEELGRGDDARCLFTFALSAYGRAGAERDVRRVRARLAAVDAQTRRARPVEGWSSLTDGERRVVSLVAQGLTNRQAAERAFLSRHTIDFHLRQAYRKLNISSRVELVRQCLEHERTTP